MGWEQYKNQNPLLKSTKPKVVDPTKPAQVGQPVQPVQPVQPIKSNLPPMQPQQVQQPKIAPTTQQQAGAVVDPRFSQAVSSKLKQDLEQKQKELAEQKQKFQTDLAAARASGYDQSSDMASLIQAITAPPDGTEGTEQKRREAEEKYSRLQRMEYTGPTGLDDMANIAALTQLSSSPELLAKQYGVAPTGARGGDYAFALGASRQPALTDVLMQASKLSEQAQTEKERAELEAQAIKGKTELGKTEAQRAIRGEEQKLMAELEAGKTQDVKEKEEAFNRVKEGLLFGGSVKKSDLRKLGLDLNDPNTLNILNQGYAIGGQSGIAQIEGMEGVNTLDQFKQKIQALKDKKSLQGEDSLTPEQKMILSLEDKIQGLSPSTSEGGAFEFASKNQLARINALRRLTGQTEKTEADVGKAAEKGTLSNEKLATLFGQIKEAGTYSEDTIKDVGSRNEVKIKDLPKINEIDTKIKELYDSVMNKGSALDLGERFEKLVSYAKSNKGKSSHAQWVYDQMQSFKDPVFGTYNDKKVANFINSELPKVTKRITNRTNLINQERNKRSQALKRLRLSEE